MVKVKSSKMKAQMLKRKQISSLQDRTLRKCSVNIFSEWASRRVGRSVASAIRRGNLL